VKAEVNYCCIIFLLRPPPSLCQTCFLLLHINTWNDVLSLLSTWWLLRSHIFMIYKRAVQQDEQQRHTDPYRVSSRVIIKVYVKFLCAWGWDSVRRRNIRLKAQANKSRRNLPFQHANYSWFLRWTSFETELMLLFVHSSAYQENTVCKKSV